MEDLKEVNPEEELLSGLKLLEDDDACIYTVTGIEGFDNEGTCGALRCFGYYNSLERAERAVVNNACDMWEYLYDYAVIEKVEEGVFPLSFERWFYKFNAREGKFERIPEPKSMGVYINIGIG